MADKIVSTDITKPGQFKANGPTLVNGQVPLAGLDGTGAALNDIVTFNGSSWIPAAGPPSADTASNLGAGAQSFKSKVGNDFQFRSIIATGGSSATQNANDITINSVVETASNLGSGSAIFSSKVGVDFQFKTLLAGSNITLTPGANDVTISASSGSAGLPVIILQDQKADTTVGGTATSGSLQTRVLNTEVVDTGNNCALAANQFTLAAGTYYIRASATFNNTNQTILVLRNATAATNILIGQDSDIRSCGLCEVQGVFTVGAAQALELQYYATTSVGSNIELGRPLAGGFTEIYSTVYLEKRA